jgi:hypothetical protein
MSNGEDHGTNSITPDAILRLGFGFWASKTLLSAVELGLFTALAEAGPSTLQEAAGRIGLHARSARDFLDALVALRVLDRSGEKYANTPEADHFLDRRKPGYVGGALEMANARLYPFWGSLTTALRTGEPQNESRHGGDVFAELYADPGRLEGFLKAMTGISLGPARAIAASFPWERYGRFADLGAAQGALSVQVASTHSHLAGIGFDLPPVRPHFESYVAMQGLSDRVTFQAGDFFADPLPTVDVLVMGHVLHDWDLERKLALIRKAYAALPQGGALLVYESLIDDDRRENATGLLMSLNMLIETAGGFDYTAADCIGWMREAGFRETRAEPLVGPESMIIGIK